MQRSLPLIRRVLTSHPAINPARSHSRGWDLMRPSSDLQRVFRDLDRRMEAFERDFLKFSPFRFSQTIPVEGVPDKTKFRVDVDIGGFQPEDVKVSLKDHRLRIEAKMDKTGEDGSRVQQHLVREFALPESVDDKSFESFLHGNGVLTIEATHKEVGARKIDVTHEDTPSIESKEETLKGKN